MTKGNQGMKTKCSPKPRANASTFLFRILLLMACGTLTLNAGPRTSASYSVLTDALDYGGVPASSAIYQHIGSAGLINGFSSAPFGIELKPGYIAQLDFAALQILGAVSRKTHGAIGTFDVNLPLTGPPGIECRSGGVGGNYQVVVTFATPISVGGLSVVSINGQAGGTQSVSGAVVTVNLSRCR